MESNEQTELTSKIRDRLVDGEQLRQLVGGREARGGGTEQKGKRTHGQGQQCGDHWGEGGIR